MQLTLKQLEALYWSAILGSFAQAAERLHMTQSALSKRIIDLELEIGEKLFDRSGSRAKITDAGEGILAKAEQMLALRDEIMVMAKGTKSLRGTCRFGISELMAMSSLPKFVHQVRETFPEVEIEPRVAVTQELLEDMERGEIDFAICPGTSNEPLVESQLLRRVNLVWCAATGLFPKDEVITVERLQEHHIVSMSATAGSTMVLKGWASENQLKFRNIIASNSPQAVVALTIAGLGIALLSEPLVESFVSTGQIQKLRVEDRLSVPDLPYFLHWRTDNNRMLTKAVRELARRIFSE